MLDSSVLVAAERAKRTTTDVIQHIRAAVGDVPIIICALTVAERLERPSRALRMQATARLLVIFWLS